MESTTGPYPLYANAVILPVLALPAWFLCIPPLIWHFSQRNIAAWSLILWIILMNFFNFINPLIWPRDNIDQWFNGYGLCDIEVRIFVGLSVGLPSCTAMILRKLAKVMDTRSIRVSIDRNKRIRENVLELLWCWGYPVVMILVYYVVQPLRYFIHGISGCVVAYNLSWVSIVLGAMWPPITVVVAAYYGGLLIYRLYLYRREFSRLISARNTTKSRFIRLFVMSATSVVVVTPYVFWVTWLFASQLNEEFSWEYVHGPGWNTVVKVPSFGHVRVDKWGQIATGYVAFAVFGTGTDANNTYKRILCMLGLGKIFPSLYRMSESGSSTPLSYQSAKGWISSYGSKARHLFSKKSEHETLQSNADSSVRNNSLVALDTSTLDTPASTSFQAVQSNDPMFSQREREWHQQQPAQAPKNRKSIYDRVFNRPEKEQPILPLFSRKKGPEVTETEKSPTDTISPGVHAHVSVPRNSDAAQPTASDGVTIIREVHQKDSVRRG